MSDTAASDNALALASKHTVLPVRTGHLKPPRLFRHTADRLPHGGKPGI